MSDDTPEERERVFSRIAPIIMDFRKEFRPGDFAFHTEELREYVIARVPGIAPDSPSRILRELRLRGRLNYTVLNRRQSLYEFRSIDGIEETEL